MGRGVSYWSHFRGLRGADHRLFDAGEGHGAVHSETAGPVSGRGLKIAEWHRYKCRTARR